ncbi:MAG: sigma-70 family RNA polymerase sigma factor [Deltaproteobacteria bacterium]|nr:sigma-70 family RNA polymerase sigma factor [Deltaproteobacteria bacterium]
MDDTSLLLRIAGKDRDAFTAFYDQYSPRIYGLLMRLLHSREDADDVLQEVFVQVWDRAGTYDPQRAHPFGWLVLLTRSRALDRLRRRRRDPGALPALYSGYAAAPDHGAEVDAAWAADDGLRRLPQEQATAIGLAFFEGLTHEQIAQRLAAPLGTVKTRIRTGLRRLREIMELQALRATG